MSNPPNQDPELDIAEQVGRLMQFWGFKRPMGRIWALLYLSPQPLSAYEIADRLRMSAGSVSMTLAELVKWGAVIKSWRPGERRDFYEAETGIWRLVQRVFRERELRLITEFASALRHAEQAIDCHAPAAEQQFMQGRLHELLQLSETGENLLNALVAGRPVDPKSLSVPSLDDSKPN
jgi:DNA-binding transcriptional regulator GbsR (MarR family)